MAWIQKTVRLATLLAILAGSTGCIQVAPSEPLSTSEGRAASTQLAVQATRIAALETADAELAAEITRQAGFISYLATRVPANVPTPRRGPPTPFGEFNGSVSIEGGKCCVGGVAGEVLSISVEFRARSPFADVTDLRVVSSLGSPPEDAIAEADWEPFVPTKVFDVTPPINWVGFYVAAQYRDALGNLSQVFQSEISVEGSPQAPDASPGP